MIIKNLEKKEEISFTDLLQYCIEGHDLEEWKLLDDSVTLWCKIEGQVQSFTKFVS